MLLKTLVTKEILNNLINLRFTLAYFLCTFLLVGSASIMVADYCADKRNYNADANFHMHDLDGISSASEIMYRDKTILRPPNINRIFAVGGEKDPDQCAIISINKAPFMVGTFMRNPLSTLFPTIDMIFIIGIILSLIIFVLTHDSISGERDEGTLKVLLSGPIPRDLIYIAKWLGGFITLAIPLITSWLLIMIILLFTPSIGVETSDWFRMLAILVICLLYIGVTFSLALMISVISRSSVSAILSLLVYWALVVVALPSISGPLAYSIVKPLGMSLYETNLTGRIMDEQKNFGAKYEKLWKQFEGQFINGEPTPAFLEAQQKLFREIEGMFGTWAYEEVQAVLRTEESVENLSRIISRFSPFGCLQNAGIMLAGTGMRFEKDFRTAIGKYYRDPILYRNKLADDKAPFNFAEAPTFKLVRSSFIDDIAASGIDVAVLILMGGFFFLVGYGRFLRMELL